MPPLACQPYIDSFINYEIRTGIDPQKVFKAERVRAFLRALGDPQRKLTCLHIAGTKGKGSTAVFLAHILRRAGFRTGLYTSPHLYYLNERIRLLAPVPAAREERGLFPDEISDREFEGLLSQIKPVAEGFRRHPDYGELTYFELLTALAFCFFAEAKADLVVLETGMGGRLDASNVIDPLACGLTAIGLDHTAQLGTTVEQIAREKVAIVKPGKPVVIAPQRPEVSRVIDAYCRQAGCPAVWVGKDILVESHRTGLDGQSFLVRAAQRQYDLSTRLRGSFQLNNAATAVGLAGIVRDKGYAVPASAVAAGIAETFWPVRFEVISQQPAVVLDAAHNPDSIKALVDNIQCYFPGGKKIVVLGLSRDKDIPGIGRIIQAFAGDIIPVRADHPRAYDFSDPVLNGVLKIQPGDVRDARQGLLDAMGRARSDDVVVVTGSIFIAAEARAFLKKSLKISNTTRLAS